MKKILIRLLTILIYILALLSLVEFKISVLFNIKMIIMVAFGTVLLTATSYKKGMTFEDLKIPAGWNAMLTAYLTTFVMLFSRLSGNQDDTNLMQDVAMNCRPLLYGLIISILLKSEIQNKEKIKSPVPTLEMQDHMEMVELRLKEAGLTDREIEITFCICNRLSNKEIGEKLYITESTVKKHTSNFYKKIHVSNREQLIYYIQNIAQ